MTTKQRRSAKELLMDGPTFPEPCATTEKPSPGRYVLPIMTARLVEQGGTLTLDAPSHLGLNPLTTSGFLPGDSVYIILATRGSD